MAHVSQHSLVLPLNISTVSFHKKQKKNQQRKSQKNSWFHWNNTKHKDDTGWGSWCTTNRIRDAVTAAWKQLLTFPPTAKQTSDKKEPVWVQSELFFHHSSAPFPPLRAEKHSASASCLNCFQTSHSAAGMNKGTNMTGMLRKQEFRLRNAFMEEIRPPHPVFWVHVVLSYLESSLRCFGISWTILFFGKKKKRKKNDLEIALKIWFYSSFFLSTRDDFNIKVLQAFVELHEFADLNLVQALRSARWLTQIIERGEDKSSVLWTRTLCGATNNLLLLSSCHRQFLWSFRLPGEAQKIDRMMEAFASRYCQCNPGVFQSTGQTQRRLLLSQYFHVSCGNCKSTPWDKSLWLDVDQWWTIVRLSICIWVWNPICWTKSMHWQAVQHNYCLRV